jgi:hydrogenase maturation protease
MIVACVGNAFRGDDGAGLEVARLLRERGVAVVELEMEPTRLLDLLAETDTVILVDAVSSGAAPGTVHKLDVAARPLPHGLFRGSTHHFSLADTIELARTLGRLPQRATVYAIEGGSFEAGEWLSPEVQAAAEQTADAIAEGERCTSSA